MSFLALMMARLTARRVGQDGLGNTYFESRGLAPIYHRSRRFVVPARGNTSGEVPPEWHGWLHHTTDAPIVRPAYAWLRPFRPNPTGSALAERPAGSDLATGHRRPTGGDYEAWRPSGAEGSGRP